MGSERTWDLVINYGMRRQQGSMSSGRWRSVEEWDRRKSSWKRGVYCDLFLVLNFLV